MLERITCHAVVRYLERVLSLPVAEWLQGKEHLPENVKAEICCERAGLPVAAVRLCMLTPPVIRQMNRKDANKAKVITSDGIYVIAEGRLITVLGVSMQTYRKKKYKPHKSRQMEEV